MHYTTSLVVGCAGAAAAFYIYRRLVKQEPPYSYPPRENFEAEGYQQLMMKVPRESIGVILGRQGRNVALLQFETGAFLNVYQCGSDEIRMLKSREPYSQWARHDVEEDWLDPEKKEEKEGAAYGFVKIQAPTMEQVELAVMKIKAIVADWRRHCASERVKVPKDALGYVIGKHGKNIKSISYVCRVRTRVIDETEEYEELLISGSELGVAQAVERIENSVDRYYRTYHNRSDTKDANESVETISAGKTPVRSDLYEDVTLELHEIIKLREELEAEEEIW